MENVKIVWAFISQQFHKTGAMPSFNTVMAGTGLSQEVVFKVYQQLVANNYLKKENNRYQIVQARKAVEEAKAVAQQEIKHKGETVVKGVMLAISCICVAISIRYTALFSMLFMPAFFAYLMAAAIVLFSVFSLSASFLLAKAGKKAQSYLWRFLWVVAIGYSITTSVAGQYNRYALVNVEKNQQAQVALVSQSHEAILQDQIRNSQSAIQRYEDELQGWKELFNDVNTSAERRNQYWNSFNQASANIIRIDNLISNERAILRGVQEQLLLVVSESTPVAIPDFFTWISGVLGANQGKVQFLISLFPALFLDLISPIAMAFALTFRKEN